MEGKLKREIIDKLPEDVCRVIQQYLLKLYAVLSL